MNKFSIIRQQENTFVTTKLQGKQQLNMRAVDMLAQDVIPGLLPVSISNEKKKLQLVYDISPYVSLAEYCRKLLRKDEFLEMIKRILTDFRTIHEKYLHIEKVLLDLDYVMMDPDSKDIFLIYVPVQEYDSNILLKDFFLEVAFAATFDNSEDTQYVKEYINFLKSRQTFSLYEFVKFVERLETSEGTAEQPDASAAQMKPVVCPKCGTQNVPDSQFCAGCGATMPVSSGFMAVPTPAAPPAPSMAAMASMTPRPPASSRMLSSVGEAVPLAAGASGGIQTPMTSGSMSSMSMFSQPPAYEMQPAFRPMSNVNPVSNVMDPEGTTLLGESQAEEARLPYLVRTKTGEKITIDQMEFRMGKDPNGCDYCISNNTVISRLHAQILIKEDGYYVCDCNSTNKTYLDGKVLPPKTEIAIFSGSKLRLANEEFTFYIM